MHTLRLLERLSSVDYTSLSLMRELNLWDLIYGSAFFGFAEEQVMRLPAVWVNAFRIITHVGPAAWMMRKDMSCKKQSLTC